MLIQVLVRDNDPSLMFANSGGPIQECFTGLEQRLQRATTSQKCVRAGGKHNDLENVGFTTRHHTFLKCSVTTLAIISKKRQFFMLGI